ncbi:hypothetical protein BC628DRAFT_1331343 [Trametes gibbosa]|nr:hypothetical protein BC628DRAFT_1331343 [Trametes gibbosa]
MRFSTTTLAYLAAAIASALAPQVAHAGVTAFSGSNCDGNVGLNVPCDGSCHKFDDRHSFRVDSGTGDHCVTVFVDEGCPSDGQGFPLPHQEGQCQNVNTGTNIRSFLCSKDTFCFVG